MQSIVGDQAPYTRGLECSEHVVSLLLLERATRKPLPINYSQQAANTVDAQTRKVTGATLTLAAKDTITPGTLELVVLHDLCPVGRFDLQMADPVAAREVSAVPPSNDGLRSNISIS